MKKEAAGPVALDYPQLVHQGVRHNIRSPLYLSNRPAPANLEHSNVVTGRGTLDRDGNLTAQGRKALIELVTRFAVSHALRYCVVWSANSCTYFRTDGSTRESCSPPREIIPSPRHVPTSPIRCEPMWSTPISNEGGITYHLCVLRNGRYVEIMIGIRVLLADAEDHPPGRKNDPLAHLRTKSGRWKRRLVHRGHPVEQISDGSLLGPVQPFGRGEHIILRDPWPQQFEEACETVAETKLPRAVLDAAWAYIEPRQDSIDLADIVQDAA
jgi:hypothetical protein